MLYITLGKSCVIHTFAECVDVLCNVVLYCFVLIESRYLQDLPLMTQIAKQVYLQQTYSYIFIRLIKE